MPTTVVSNVDDQAQVVELSQEITMEFGVTAGAHIGNVNVPDFTATNLVDVLAVAFDPLTVVDGHLTGQGGY